MLRTGISLLATFCLAPSLLWAAEINLNESAAAKIGRRIWQNECGGTVSGLTSWNKGEEFPSLGIGHFIWYPKGYRGPFEESFPGLTKFLKANGAELPKWLEPGMPSPWSTREAFYADIDSSRMKDLRALLKNTVGLQTEYIVQRLEAALPKMLEAAPAAERATVRARFFEVASTPAGVYALVDYVNFKGEGTSPTERYNGHGWGLLQVLQGMEGKGVAAFAASAKRALTRRVENSPPARNEAKWLPGWKSRIDTYLSF